MNYETISVQERRKLAKGPRFKKRTVSLVDSEKSILKMSFFFMGSDTLFALEITI